MDSEASLFMATTSFVVGHFILSSIPMRTGIIGKVGEKGFRLLYSLVSAIAFLWMLKSYSNAFYQPIWEPPVSFQFITLAFMLGACFFLLCSLTSKSPTMIGGEKTLTDENPSAHPVSGIITITRHPMLVSMCLWSVGHLLSNGDLATIILAGGIFILSVGGMFHIDHRRRIAAETNLKSQWGVVVLTSSSTPFLAIIEGRTKLDWKGIGLWRALGSVALFAALLYGHIYIAGVALMPQVG